MPEWFSEHPAKTNLKTPLSVPQHVQERVLSALGQNDLNEQQDQNLRLVWNKYVDMLLTYKNWLAARQRRRGGSARNPLTNEEAVSIYGALHNLKGAISQCEFKGPESESLIHSHLHQLEIEFLAVCPKPKESGSKKKWETEIALEMARYLMAEGGALVLNRKAAASVARHAVVDVFPGYCVTEDSLVGRLKKEPKNPLPNKTRETVEAKWILFFGNALKFQLNAEATLPASTEVGDVPGA